MDSFIRSRHVDTGQIPDKTVCISHRHDNSVKSINPVILPPGLGNKLDSWGSVNVCLFVSFVA